MEKPSKCLRMSSDGVDADPELLVHDHHLVHDVGQPSVDVVAHTERNGISRNALTYPHTDTHTLLLTQADPSLFFEERIKEEDS